MDNTNTPGPSEASEGREVSSHTNNQASQSETEQSSKNSYLDEMTEFDKYEVVNKAKTVEDLIAAVDRIGQAGLIEGSNRTWDSEGIIGKIWQVYRDEAPFNLLTRTYGIRQQLMYIMYYEGRIHLL